MNTANLALGFPRIYNYYYIYYKLFALPPEAFFDAPKSRFLRSLFRFAVGKPADSFPISFVTLARLDRYNSSPYKGESLMCIQLNSRLQSLDVFFLRQVIRCAGNGMNTAFATGPARHAIE
jgi:hypothetical protein